MPELSVRQLRALVRVARSNLRNVQKRDCASPQIPAMRRKLEELQTQLQQAKRNKPGLLGKWLIAACRNAGLPMPRDP